MHCGDSSDDRQHDAMQDNQLEHNLDRLRYAAMDLLTKLSRQFKHRRAATIFLINNYTCVVQVGSFGLARNHNL